MLRDVVVWVWYLVPKGCFGGDVEGVRAQGPFSVQEFQICRNG